MRQNLIGQLSDIPGLILNLDDKSSCELLLSGDAKYNVANNRKIREATISLIKSAKRFSDINELNYSSSNWVLTFIALLL